MGHLFSEELVARIFYIVASARKQSRFLASHYLLVIPHYLERRNNSPTNKFGLSAV